MWTKATNQCPSWVRRTSARPSPIGGEHLRRDGGGARADRCRRRAASSRRAGGRRRARAPARSRRRRRCRDRPAGRSPRRSRWRRAPRKSGPARGAARWPPASVTAISVFAAFAYDSRARAPEATRRPPPIEDRRDALLGEVAIEGRARRARSCGRRSRRRRRRCPARRPSTRTVLRGSRSVHVVAIDRRAPVRAAQRQVGDPRPLDRRSRSSVNVPFRTGSVMVARGATRKPRGWRNSSCADARVAAAMTSAAPTAARISCRRVTPVPAPPPARGVVAAGQLPLGAARPEQRREQRLQQVGALAEQVEEVLVADAQGAAGAGHADVGADRARRRTSRGRRGRRRARSPRARRPACAPRASPSIDQADRRRVGGVQQHAVRLEPLLAGDRRRARAAPRPSCARTAGSGAAPAPRRSAGARASGVLAAGATVDHGAGALMRAGLGPAHDQAAGAERRVIEHPAEQALHQVGVVGEQAERFLDASAAARPTSRWRAPCPGAAAARARPRGRAAPGAARRAPRRRAPWRAPGRRAGGGRATAASRPRRACGRDRGGPGGRCGRCGTARRSRPTRRSGWRAAGWRSRRWAAARATARAASTPAAAGRPASTTPLRRRASRGRRGAPARDRGRRPASAARGGRRDRWPPPTPPRRRC